MPIRTFDDWAVTKAQTYPLAALKDAVIGIEAEYFLGRLLATAPTKEPLLPALGGFPFALRDKAEKILESIKSIGITPLFVFSGLDLGTRDRSTEGGENEKVNAHAWELYIQQQAQEAVVTFGESSSVKPERLFRFLQQILYDRNIDFLVAPYTAWAQLAYFERIPTRFVDAIMGSSELFLFDVDKVITNFDFDRSEFSWLSRRALQDELGKISPDVFVDACLLAGSAFLPTFPPLEASRKSFNFRDSINMILSLGRTAVSVCTHYQDEPRVQQMNYLDKYKRARLAVKHHVVITEDGKVEPLNVGQAPSDVHEFIGQRLPEELYFYLSKGVTGPRVLNWLTSGTIFEPPPLDGGEGQVYRVLVRDRLAPLKTQALALLSQPGSRYYHSKDVVQRVWFEKEVAKPLSHKNLVPSPREIISDWNVQESTFKDQAVKIKSKPAPGTLAFAVASLSDEAFSKATITAKDVAKPLNTKDEILANTLWRLLHLRGYVDINHCLTTWGKALYSALSALKPEDHLEEAMFLAIELVRLQALTIDPVKTPKGATTSDSSAKEVRNTLFVSSLACLVKLTHQPEGFTGPLSRELLAFHSCIYAVRNSLRDLSEMILVNLFLNGDANRNRDNWTELGLSLPFAEDVDCGLGVAVKSYLDDVALEPEPATAKDRAQEKVASWIRYSLDIPGDLQKSFRMFDAVHAGVKAAGKEVKQADEWAEVERWLAERR